jgi:energy-converting hydrogenase Eha subunit C
MLSSNLIRWGAIATMLAGALSIFIGVASSQSFVDVAWLSNLVESARWVLLGVGLVGLYLYLRRSSRFGWLGAVSSYTLIVGCVLSTIVYLGSVPNDGGVALVAVPLESVGSVLFGVGILRAGSLPRAGAWLLIVSIPIFVIAVVASTAIGNSPWTNWFFVMGEVVFGSGCIVLGSRLWSHRGESVQTVPLA